MHCGSGLDRRPARAFRSQFDGQSTKRQGQPSPQVVLSCPPEKSDCNWLQRKQWFSVLSRLRLKDQRAVSSGMAADWRASRPASCSKRRCVAATAKTTPFTAHSSGGLALKNARWAWRIASENYYAGPFVSYIKGTLCATHKYPSVTGNVGRQISAGRHVQPWRSSHGKGTSCILRRAAAEQEGPAQLYRSSRRRASAEQCHWRRPCRLPINSVAAKDMRSAPRPPWVERVQGGGCRWSGSHSPVGSNRRHSCRTIV